MAIGSYHLNRFSHFEYGQVVLGEREVEDTAVIQPLKAIIRVQQNV